MNKLQDDYIDQMLRSGAYLFQVQDAVRLVLRDASIEDAAEDLVSALQCASKDAYMNAFAKLLSETRDIDAAGDAAMLAAEEAAEKALKEYQAAQQETSAGEL